MEWSNLYDMNHQPDLEQIDAFVHSDCWNRLRKYLEDTYQVSPKIEYSRCSGKPGWNVKYRKSSRALCTLYPDDGFFTCMVSIGTKEASETELLLNTCTAYVQNLYARADVFNGGRWLMIDVTDEQILMDVKELIQTRVKVRKKST